MANRNTINSLVQRHIIPEIADNFYDSHPYFWFMVNKGRVVEKDSDFSYPILKADQTDFGAYDGLDDISPAAAADIVTDLDYPMAHFKHSFIIPFTDFLKGAGPNSVKDLLMLHKESTQISLVEGLASQLWTDQDATVSQLLGIPRILSTTTSATVGGVDTDAESVWAPVNKAASGGSFAPVREDLESVVIDATFGMDRPDIALMNRSAYKEVLALFTSQERFLNHDALKVGFDSIMIMGIPHFIDPKGTGTGASGNDNVVYYLNSRYLRLAYNPKDWFVSRPIDDNWISQRVVGAQFFVTLQHAVMARRMQAQVSAIRGL